MKRVNGIGEDIIAQNAELRKVSRLFSGSDSNEFIQYLMTQGFFIPTYIISIVFNLNWLTWFLSLQATVTWFSVYRRKKLYSVSKTEWAVIYRPVKKYLLPAVIVSTLLSILFFIAKAGVMLTLLPFPVLIMIMGVELFSRLPPATYKRLSHEFGVTPRELGRIVFTDRHKVLTPEHMEQRLKEDRFDFRGNI